MINPYYLVIILIALFVAVITVFFRINTIIKRFISPQKKDKVVNYTLAIGGFFLLFAILSPFLFTSTKFGNSIKFSSETGFTGDTFGIMNPFIAMVGIALTFLAFYMQKAANDEIKNQFQVQQFESQFYEMLRLHKENVAEIEIQTFNGEISRGRSSFYSAKNELHWILSQLTESIPYNTFSFNSTEDIVVGEKPNIDEMFETKFKLAYDIFFWGIPQTPNFIIRGWTFSFSVTGQLYQYKSKWHAYLGHYYRHLFYMVKYIIEMPSEFVNENAKANYLKLVRAQLSNYEQIMLFYNWLSSYGENWEIDKFATDGNLMFSNQYFTKYKMIHNLWSEELYEAPFSNYITKNLQQLKDKSLNLFGRELLEENEN